MTSVAGQFAEVGHCDWAAHLRILYAELRLEYAGLRIVHAELRFLCAETTIWLQANRQHWLSLHHRRYLWHRLNFIQQHPDNGGYRRGGVRLSMRTHCIVGLAFSHCT